MANNFHRDACWGDSPNPHDCMVNHAAARFFKTLNRNKRVREGLTLDLVTGVSFIACAITNNHELVVSEMVSFGFAITDIEYPCPNNQYIPKKTWMGDRFEGPAAWPLHIPQMAWMEDLDFSSDPKHVGMAGVSIIFLWHLYSLRDQQRTSRSK